MYDDTKKDLEQSTFPVLKILRINNASLKNLQFGPNNLNNLLNLNLANNNIKSMKWIGDLKLHKLT